MRLNIKGPFPGAHDRLMRSVLGNAVDVHLRGADHEIHVGEAGVTAGRVEFLLIQLLATDQRKAVGAPASIFRGIGKEEREILQGVLDNVHSQFIKAVAEGRKMLPSDVEKIADGRVFTGEQALKVGLIDEIGNLEDAVQTAAKLSGIKGEPVIVSKKERFSFIDLIREGVPKELTNIIPTVKLKYLYTP